MPLKSYTGPWIPLTPAEGALRESLRRDVQVLAGEIGERNVFRPKQYQAAADFIQKSFADAGLVVNRYAYEASQETCLNLEAVIPGGKRSNEVIVVGAHYDSVHSCPGANDNGSAVAALLALARMFGHARPECTLRLVAFANEEPPFFQTERMGSLVYAQQCRAKGDQITAMLSLETMGYYSDAPGSQQYPFPVGLFYPSVGNFIAFVGNSGSTELVRRCVRTFRERIKFPSEGAALPPGLPGVGWSDHWSFWQAGYPGVMVTDTAPFRYRWYHTAEDTPDKLDYDRLARVVAGVAEVLTELTGSTSPALAPPLER